MLQVKEVKEVKECPDCASLNIVLNQEKDQIVCKECGLIFEPMIPLEGGPAIEEITQKKTKKAVKKKSVKKKMKRR